MAPRLAVASIAADRLGQVGQVARDAVALPTPGVGERLLQARHEVVELFGATAGA